jgi:hypothetical protein
VSFSQDTIGAVEPFFPAIQEGPRLNTQPPQSLQQSRVPFRHREKNPKVAGWLSAAIPGAGQVYNGHWWKVPIIYGGAYGLYYLHDFNKTERDLFQKELRLRINSELSESSRPTQELVDSLGLNNNFILYTGGQIRSGRDHYRRNLELVYVFSGLLYFLNIIDAVVFAHLATFDVSENLTMNIQPFASPDLSNYAMQNQRMPMQGGLRLTFTLK